MQVKLSSIDTTIFNSFQKLKYGFFQTPLLVVMVQGLQLKPMIVVKTMGKVADCLKGIVIGAVHVLLFRFHLNSIMILSKFYWIKLVF